MTDKPQLEAEAAALRSEIAEIRDTIAELEGDGRYSSAKLEQVRSLHAWFVARENRLMELERALAGS